MTRFLTISDVIELNKRMIKMYTPTEIIGVKDQSLLESAIFRPQQSVFGEDAYLTIWDKATALFESLAKNHAFHNANKRTALISLVMFLRINDIKFKMDQKEAENLTVDFVKHKYTFEEVSKIIQNNSSLGDY